jgi:2-keto-4-pentenoate hydratase/2-oxohepta-3-ene-1,7-dioic acid hydratase in catechol pathway
MKDSESVLSLLSNWEHNFGALSAISDVLQEHCCDANVERVGRRVSRAIESVSIRGVRVHAPLLPRQIFCAIGNYRSNIADSMRDPDADPRLGVPNPAKCLADTAGAIEKRLRSPPYFCLKLPSAVAGPSDPLEIPRHAQRADWELELGVILGKSARRVSRRDATKCIAGYTLVNDITLRELAIRDDLPRLSSDWLQCKSGPGFLPMGPYFVPAAFVPDPYALRLTLKLNGETMQDELVSDMLFDIATQIEYLSQHAQLLPGDVICTGTPAGCGTRHKRFLKSGDVMESSSEGFGTQLTSCIAERLSASDIDRT